MKKLNVLLLICTFGAFTLMAQQPTDPKHHENVTPEMRATHKADMLKKALQLTDAQYKQVYKLYLNDFKVMAAKHAEMKAKMEKENAEKPAQNDKKEAQSPAKHPGYGNMMYSKEYAKMKIERTEKMMKILDDEQFAKWQKMESEQNHQGKHQCNGKHQCQGHPQGHGQHQCQGHSQCQGHTHMAPQGAPANPHFMHKPHVAKNDSLQK